jgi:hypothetical protein
VVGFGEDGVVEQGRGPSEVAGVVRGPGEVDDFVYTADGVDVAGRELGGWILPQSCRVAVEPAHVSLVDRFDVVTDRPVIAARRPSVFQGRGQLDHFGDLGAGLALVEESQSLVVQVGIDVALRGQVVDDLDAAPGRPMV